MKEVRMDWLLFFVSINVSLIAEVARVSLPVLFRLRLLSDAIRLSVKVAGLALRPGFWDA